MFLRALAIDEKVLASDSPDLAVDVFNLANFYGMTKRPEQSARLFQRALDIRTKALGLKDRDTIQTMVSYAAVLRSLHRDQEAEALEEKADSVYKAKTGTK